LSYGRLVRGWVERPQDWTRIAERREGSESENGRRRTGLRDECDPGHSAWTDPICPGSGRL